MNDISFDKLMDYKNNAQKKFNSYRLKSNLLWAAFLIINFMLFKYGIKTHNLSTKLNNFELIWVFFVIIFLYIDKFYFEEKLKQQKRFYHHYIKQIKEKSEIASEAIKEKELLEKKIKEIPKKTKIQKI